LRPPIDTLTIDLAMKPKAIASIKPPHGSRNRTKPWRPKNTVLEWLESL